MRTSNDIAAEYYDYDRQCWVVDGIVTLCGHPDYMGANCCYAGTHAGERIATPARLLSEAI